MPSLEGIATQLLGLPLHPAVIHFPIVTTMLALAACLVCFLKPSLRRKEWLDRATLLAFIAVLSTPLAIISGRAWSRSLGLWREASWFPASDVEGGLLRRHVEGALLTMALSSVALLLALASRRQRAPLWALILVVAAAAIAAVMTAHVGGRMVFGVSDSNGPPKSPGDVSAPTLQISESD